MPYAPLLSVPEVQSRLQRLDGWHLMGSCIVKQFQLRTFQKSLDFVSRVGDLAEAADHHPDITINYNRVILSFSTHASKGLTNRDFDLAGEIDHLDQNL